MLTRFVFLVALLSFTACARDDVPEPSEANADAIAAGKIDPHDLAVVALRVPDGATCSGVVVGPRMVLTSRACVTGVRVSDCLRPIPQPPDVTQEERDPS